jgi:hypothetical protein
MPGHDSDLGDNEFVEGTDTEELDYDEIPYDPIRWDEPDDDEDYERQAHNEGVDELGQIKDLEALREVIETAEVDEGTGAVTIWARSLLGGEDATVIRTLEEMKSLLEEFGWDEEVDGTGFKSGAGHFVLGGRRAVSREDVLEAILRTDAASLFRGSIVVPTTTLYRFEPELVLPIVKVELATINEELIRYLARNPKSLYVLEPRRFEELIAELFRDLGYEVLLTPRTRDGGVDLRAVRKDSIGTLLYLVECKRYGPSRPVGVDLVRGLYGVAKAEGASCGILATTSRFTKDAQEFARRFQYQLSLRDHTNIVAWLEQYLRRRN